MMEYRRQETCLPLCEHVLGRGDWTELGDSPGSEREASWRRHWGLPPRGWASACTWWARVRVKRDALAIKADYVALFAEIGTGGRIIWG